MERLSKALALLLLVVTVIGITGCAESTELPMDASQTPDAQAAREDNHGWGTAIQGGSH